MGNSDDFGMKRLFIVPTSPGNIRILSKLFLLTRFVLISRLIMIYCVIYLYIIFCFFTDSTTAPKSSPKRCATRWGWTRLRRFSGSPIFRRWIVAWQSSCKVFATVSRKIQARTWCSTTKTMSPS